MRTASTAEIAAAREIPLIFSDIGLFPSDDAGEPDLWEYDPVQNAIWQTFTSEVTVEGASSILNGGFTTGDYKLRYYLLADDWRDELYAYMGGTAHDHKATILKSGGIEDHVHLLVKIHPSFAISDTVKLVKANASRWINEQRGYYEADWRDNDSDHRCIPGWILMLFEIR